MGTLATRSVLCLALVLVGIAPSAGITYGLPDGETHPNVGLIRYRLEFPHPDLGTKLQEPAGGKERGERRHRRADPRPGHGHRPAPGPGGAGAGGDPQMKIPYSAIPFRKMSRSSRPSA